MNRLGRLTITTENVSAAHNTAADLAPGDYVLVSVSDTGCGMSEEVLLRAFEPFYTTKETGKGTGLGLSQVYGFAKQSDGTAQIESEIGRGTIVRMYLPAKSTRQRETLQSRRNSPIRRTAAPRS
jgi:signal transduction histidine kinase